jgi:hypothetical protein
VALLDRAQRYRPPHRPGVSGRDVGQLPDVITSEPPARPHCSVTNDQALTDAVRDAVLAQA